jgi:hypothetical protein
MENRKGLVIWGHHPWIELFNEDKFITITTHNDARDGGGSMNIGLTSPWQGQEARNKDYKYERVIFIDSEEKFIKLYNTLLKMEE